VDEDPSKFAAKYAVTLASFINLIGWLASPRLVARAQQMPSREHLLGHTDQYLGLLEHAKQSPENPGNQSMIAAEPDARKLRELVQRWEPLTDVPTEIVQTARAFLAAYGIPDPPGGWDAFEGWPDEPAANTEAETPSPKPQPSLRQVYAASLLGGMLVGPFQLGIGGPGGWVILDKPEIHFCDGVIVPDLAAWSSERAPKPSEDLSTSIVPDWICEIDTARTRIRGFAKKMDAYARAGVRFMWLLDLDYRTIDLLRLTGDREWELYGVYGVSVSQSRIQGAPFDAIELDTSLLWEP
jgi:Uma2 family endonuclease